MPALQVDQLVFGRGQALCSPLSLQAGAGQIWAILGENGVGKSSLLLTLAGLLRPLGGRVYLDGVALTQYPRKVLAQRLGLLLQSAPVEFPFRVREAVAAGRYAHRRLWGGLSAADQTRIDDALAHVGLADLADRPADQLSGGEQRRLAIATLLVQDPGVLLLDEPANHLDVRHQMRLMRLLRTQTERGRLVMFSTHDVNLAARHADRVLLLYPGGAHESGEPGWLLTPERLSRVYGHPLVVVGEGDARCWLAAP